MADVSALRPARYGRAEVRQRSTTQDLAFLPQLLIAAALVVFLLPLLLAIACAVFMQDGGPVIFAHRRIGRDGRVFRCFKFRSMAIDAEERLQALLASDPRARAEWARDYKLKRDPRVTALGQMLRKSSLDELPQLLNVLCGQMSLVGPRPIVAAERHLYGRYLAEYCSVRDRKSVV